MEYKFNNGEPALFINEVESKEIETIRLDYINYLNDVVITIRESLTEELIIHHFREANIYELERLRANIYFGKYPYEDINPHYNDVLEIIDGHINIIQGELYNSFCFSYNVLFDDGERGRKILENILKFHLINWMIENDCSILNMLDLQSITSRSKPKRPDIFLNITTENFYKHFASQVDEQNLSSKPMLSAFYHNLNDKGSQGLLLGIRCTQTELVTYWNTVTIKYLKSDLIINRKANRLQLLSSEEVGIKAKTKFDLIKSSFINSKTN